MRTLLLSDLHLEDGQPEPVEQLLDFLSGPARLADAVYILGDLFEFWIGDDAVTATAQRVASELSAVAETGVRCFFIHGNRDFLLGEDYATRSGLELLPESLVVDLYGVPTLVLHGDTLCTDDVEYQAFRKQSRDPAWQSRVLSMSIEERLQLAREARDASMQHTGSTAAEIMDVNDDAVRKSFADHRVTRMIHGHTHRPAQHEYLLEDGTRARRIVLADWYSGGSYLEVSPEGIQTVNLD